MRANSGVINRLAVPRGVTSHNHRMRVPLPTGSKVSALLGV